MEYPQVGPVDRYEGEEWQENFILLSDLSPYILDCIEVIIAMRMTDWLSHSACRWCFRVNYMFMNALFCLVGTRISLVISVVAMEVAIGTFGLHISLKCFFLLLPPLYNCFLCTCHALILAKPSTKSSFATNLMKSLD